MSLETQHEEAQRPDARNDDAKHAELKSLRIDRTQFETQPPKWTKWFILTGLAVVGLLGGAALAYRLFAVDTPEVQVTRARSEGSAGADTVLTAAGYIVAHHKIDVNSKVTGRVAWIGVEKGDTVRAGQVLVRLEDDEFRAQVEQSRGTVASMAAQLKQLENGSRAEEIQQAAANLDEAKATLANDKAVLERTKALFGAGVDSREQFDAAEAKYEASMQRVQSLEQSSRLMRIGPRPEQIDKARGDLLEAQGKLAFAESQLEATQIRAPVSGTILERTAEKGELVTAQFASAADTGGPRGSVVSLADLSDLQVELDISQNDFAKLGAKQRGVITTDAFPDRAYQGVIAEISPEANRQKATVQVKVKVLNPDSYLRPDMNANVRFLGEENHTQGTSASGAVVPTNALRDQNGRKFILVAFQGRAVQREVKIVSQRSDGYLVEGLTGGEDIIVNAPVALKDGDRIAVKR